MDLGIAGRTALVTGASSGIGRATADLLREEGVHVIGLSRGEAADLRADVTDPATPQRVLDHGRTIDILVNNAGTSFARSIGELADDDWRDQYELHVLGPMRLMKALAPPMAERGWGRIVNVCSSAGKRPSLTNAAYSVTKAAQLSLSRVFADTYAKQGVLVNAVTPGPVASELWTAPGGLAEQTAPTREEGLAKQAGKVPLGRFAEPVEIANVVAFLCSERASTVTGAAWSADGGAVNIVI